MDVERYLLAASLAGIISQKLAKKLCPYCKKKVTPTPYEKYIFKKNLNADINEIYVAGDGCDHCMNGYRGRIAIHEVLLIDENIRDAISNSVKKEEFRNLVYSENIHTLLQDGLIKVAQGLTTFEEIIKLIELDVEDIVIDKNANNENSDEENNENIAQN